MSARSTRRRVATGAAAGLAAGLFAAFVMDRFQAIAKPDSHSESEPATEKAADRGWIAATGWPVPHYSKPMAGQAVHYGLGAVLGIGYGIAADFEPRVATGGGTLFATASWAVLDQAAVPAAGLGAPPWKAPLGGQAFGLASHLVFGLSAEFARRIGRRLLPT